MVNLKAFCDQLSKELQMENAIEEEAPGIFTLPIEENVAIKIATTLEGFSLSSILNECPKENADLFLTEVLNANLFGQITRNCVLGLTEDGNQVTLSRMIDYNIDYKGFNELLQDFYNVALFWREQAINNLKL